MKILQAIVASAVETLDGRQGFGLVCCSKSLPEAIRQEAREYGYSSDVGGHAIYSMKRSDVSGEHWVIMNRAVPDVDYTGRTSHVSHTIAIREIELEAFFDTFDSGLPSVFEFMRNFDWTSSWERSKPIQWLEDGADLEAASMNAFRPSSIDLNIPLPPQGLLAFAYPTDGNPTPKRAMWRFGDIPAEKILEVFHKSWLCLDPWRATRKYEAHLNFPGVSIKDSWQCSFTTNLRHGRSDAFLWVALSAEYQDIPNRELIEPPKWDIETPDSIKEKLDASIGDMLVERCVQGPEVWAQSQLRLLLDEMKRAFEEEVQKKSRDIKDQVEAIVSGFRGKVQSLKDDVALYKNEGLWNFDAEADIEETHHQIEERERCAKKAAENQMLEYHEKAGPVAHLLANDRAPGSYESLVEPHCFPESLDQFNRLANDYRDARRIVNICGMAYGLRVKMDKLKESEKNLECRCTELQIKLDNADKVNEKLSQMVRSGNKPNSPKKDGKKSRSSEIQPWQTISLIAFSIVVILLVVVFIMNAFMNREKKVDSHVAKPEIEEKRVEWDQERGDLYDQIRRLESNYSLLEKKYNDLERANAVKEGDDTRPLSASPAGIVGKSTGAGDPAYPEENRAAPAGGAATVPPPANGVAPKAQGAAQSTDNQIIEPPPSPTASDKSSSAGKDLDPEPNKTSETE